MMIMILRLIMMINYDDILIILILQMPNLVGPSLPRSSTMRKVLLKRLDCLQFRQNGFFPNWSLLSC